MSQHEVTTGSSDNVIDLVSEDEESVEGDNNGTNEVANLLSSLAINEEVVAVFRTLTNEENDRINGTMTDGVETDIVASTKYSADTVKRKSFCTLRPTIWLNDEIIHYFLLLLQQRDPLVYCFSPYFMTKLSDEGNNNPVYNYNNVKSWSKNVPGGDIFSLYTIFFPINQDNVHWTLAVVNMKEKCIRYYDSLGGDGNKYLVRLLLYLVDEHQAKKDKKMDLNGWTLEDCANDTPQQHNTFDCGVYTCLFADFLSMNRSLEGISPNDVSLYRPHIALSILNGGVSEDRFAVNDESV